MNRMSRHRPENSHSRRGSLTVIAIVALALASLAAAAALRLVTMQRNQVRVGERQQQAEWLAESALELAVVRLRDDAQWKGETWSVSADLLQSRYDGQAVIRVVPSPGAVHVEIVARCPSAGTQFSAARRDFLISKNKSAPTDDPVSERDDS